ncbi:MAG: quinate 5-dehydrogenase [Firmicutes bacterium]|nr:quinate 5-dehydrogenase [Bacillota bacterium]
MRRIVSVSIGSSQRDSKAVVTVCGEKFSIERIGTDGDMQKAVALIRELDGKVAAFGMGGIDLYLQGGTRRYILREAKQIARAAQITPIVDGSGLKNTLERRAIQTLAQQNPSLFQGRNVLLTCALDRFGMAQALQETGSSVLYGDVMFALGLSLPIYRLKVLQWVVTILAPIAVQMPFAWLYPTGTKQEKSPDQNKYAKYYAWADVIAGDYHMIRRYMPEDLTGKTLITNTITPGDVEFLKRRNVRELITTTPNIEGRSFGTNVMEALLVALLNKPLADITPEDYNRMLDKIGFMPRREVLDDAFSVQPQMGT